MMFSVDDRNRVRDHVLERARGDRRVVAGAVVGSLATSDADRWSDLDLTFGLAEGVPLQEVLDEFTSDLGRTFDATPLFDLPAGAAIYRVFLIPSCLQLDLSFAPASQFGALGPQFRLVFGHAARPVDVPSPPARQLLGYAVHHALRARFCIERGRYWQAEYWVSAVRDYALSLACHRRGLPASYGRGYDQLPDDVREAALAALPRAVHRDELRRSLNCAVDLLLGETEEVQELAERVRPQLRQLAEMPSLAVTLEPFTAADRDFAFDVTQTTMRSYVEQAFGHWDANDQRRRSDESDPASCWVIVVDGVRAGILVVDDRPDEIFLARIFILPAFQRRGVGSALLRSLMERAKLEKKPLRLRVLAVNPARRLYERLGFTVTQQTPEHFYMEYR